jgi:endonuclease G
VAERANADTFHFTNCSPQHFRFNQTAKYWQGLERYVLENGLLQHAPSNSLTVFQGPIFSDAIDRWADDVQIPSSFWKIVVWQGAEGLRAVGLVADQGNLLDQPRVGMARPADLPDVDVNHWRVKISTIQRRTGLDFGAAVRGADTIGDDDQPNVAEAARPIRSFNDILL